MPITINTNTQSLRCQNVLNKSSNALSNSMRRMSSGLRINSAKDDAAGSAVSEKIQIKKSGTKIAQENIQNSLNYLQTADSALKNMEEMLSRIRNLALQSVNGTYSSDERNAMQEEVGELCEELKRTKDTAKYSGNYIFEKKVVMQEVDIITQWCEDNGYTAVSNAQELQDALNNNENILLTKNINLSGVNWEPIGDSGNPYTGILNGNGFTISNLNINSTNDSVGLIEKAQGATIKNLTLENANVKGGYYTGCLIGEDNSSTIENVSIVSSSSQNTKSGSYNWGAGGLVGYSSNTQFANCYVRDIQVKGTDRAGGMTGVSYHGSSYSNCYVSDISLSAPDDETALMGGYAGNDISNCVIDTIYDATPGNGYLSPSSSTHTNVMDSLSSDELKDINTYLNAGWDVSSDAESDSIWKLKNGEIQLAHKNEIKNIEKSGLGTKLSFHVGAEARYDNTIEVDIDFPIDEFLFDVSTSDSAKMAVVEVDEMINKITSVCADVGACVNRLNSAYNINESNYINLSSTNSSIVDADMAQESVSFAINSIMQDVSIMVLTQANQSPSIALSLV